MENAYHGWTGGHFHDTSFLKKRLLISSLSAQLSWLGGGDKPLNVNDRKPAFLWLLDKGYFGAKELIILRYTRDKDYFQAKSSDILSVWTFAGSKVNDARSIGTL